MTTAPQVVGKAILLDHAVTSATVLNAACVGGEIQPITNLPVEDPFQGETHLIVIEKAASLRLTWHPAYKWLEDIKYIPSEGMDIVTVAAAEDGSMLARFACDFK